MSCCRALGGLAVAVALLAACGGSQQPPGPCTPGGDGTYVNAPYDTLSKYCLVEIKDGEVAVKPNAGTPYDLNTPLYSDGALKRRSVWMPDGKSAQYAASKPLDFPTGTIFTKSFGFRDDVRKPAPKVSWIETRLLIKTAAGWQGYAYVWNDARTEATLEYGGKVQSISWLDQVGQPQAIDYLVPSFGQCKQCHADASGTMHLIGPTARNLNRDYPYAGGTENQLAHWARTGVLTGAPASGAPKLAVWSDPATGTVAERARAYLEVNCAHCHSADGAARTTGLFLTGAETNATALGVCKSPVAAGEGAGGFKYDIFPGKPDESIVVYRLKATTPQAAMPQIGRASVDAPGLQLVREWIAGLSGTCN